jgi:hypothetical protein
MYQPMTDPLTAYGRFDCQRAQQRGVVIELHRDRPDDRSTAPGDEGRRHMIGQTFSRELTPLEQPQDGRQVIGRGLMDLGCLHLCAWILSIGGIENSQLLKERTGQLVGCRSNGALVNSWSGDDEYDGGSHSVAAVVNARRDVGGS